MVFVSEVNKTTIQQKRRDGDAAEMWFGLVLCGLLVMADERSTGVKTQSCYIQYE